MTRTLALAALVLATTVCPAAEPEVDRKLLKPGLVATFGTTYRLEPTVALYQRAGEGPAIGRVTWDGYLQIVTAGKYQFAGTVKGGTASVTLSRGEKVIAAFGAPAVQLEPGVYKFVATFASDDKADRQFELVWEGPGFRREPVPHYFFGHLPAQRKETVEKSLPLDHGRFLFEEHGCKNCHAPKDAALVDRTGPDLSDVGKRVYPGWLDAWLADPAKLRPNTTMPKLFANDDRGAAERYAVGQYLTSLDGPLAAAKLPTISNEWAKNIANGQKLFTTTGCAACHGKQLAATAKKNEDDEDEKPVPFEPSSSFHGLGTATGSQSLYALGGLGSKTTPEQLQRYLADPLKANPHGRMPNMQLTNEEARDLARFLIRSTDDHYDRAAVKEPNLKPADFDAKSWRELGQKLVTSKGCVNCHTVAPGGKALAARTAPPAKKADAGCLAAKPDATKVPVYKFDDPQRTALAAFVGTGSRSPTDLARTAFKRFNCLNCHVRDGEGGIGTELADQMKKLENAENADDVAPPRLTGVGHKAKTTWLESVLVSGGRARPWMSLRMPQYGQQNVGHLPVTLAHLEGTVPDSSTRKVEYTQEKLEAGRKLSGSEGLGCIKCHDISGHVGGGTRGPDLARTAERLRFDWYERWMHNPQRLAPGTKMPQNFNYGKSAFDKLLKGEADPQIDAIWAYLSLGPGLPLPAGMEPPKGLIVKVGARPEILRTFMPDGAGTKAIAVGFPAGVSFAFDADACRVSYAWEGNFLDASPVWNNRGGAPAKLLGPKFLTPPKGPPWAVTAGRTPPDFDARAKDFAFGAPVPNEEIYKGPRHVHFDGYALADDGSPTFRYRVGDGDVKDELAVRETVRPAKGGLAVGLTRAFQVEVPAARTAWLLAGTTTAEPRVVGATVAPDSEVPANGTKVVLPADGRAVVLTVGAAPTGTVWRFVKAKSGWQAILRLEPSKEAGNAVVTFTAWSAPKDAPAIIDAIGK
jgi:cbb3-type cytochrome oxidase cytochrome c subunit